MGDRDEDMAKLFLMMSNMPTKDDLLTFKADIKNEVKVVVSEGVDPIKDEVATLSERVSKIENAQNGGGGGENTDSGHLQKQVGEIT